MFNILLSHGKKNIQSAFRKEIISCANTFHNSEIDFNCYFINFLQFWYFCVILLTFGSRLDNSRLFVAYAYINFFQNNVVDIRNFSSHPQYSYYYYHNGGGEDGGRKGVSLRCHRGDDAARATGGD